MLPLVLALVFDAGPESLDSLLARVPQVATDNGGISRDGLLLAQQLQTLAPDSIPPLIAMLKGGSVATRDFAGFVLGDIKGLREEHVDALVASMRSGNGWVPRAIVKTGSPRGIKILAEQLASDPQTHDQVTAALHTAGDLGANAIAAVLRRSKTPDEPFSEAVCEVFEEPAVATSAGADALLAVALDKAVVKGNRAIAIHGLGCLGPRAKGTGVHLQRLATLEPEFVSEVNEAIVGIGSADAVPVLLPMLDGHPQTVLEQIARLAENGRTAGPAVTPLLEAPDWDVRVAAARTLGLIGYTPAATALVERLHDDADWKLVHAASEALGRLKAVGALPSLEEVAKEHWDPVTRAAAARAVRRIRGIEPPEKINRSNSRRAFADPDRGDQDTSPAPPLERGKGELDERQLNALEYVREVNERTRSGRINRSSRVTRPTCGLKTGDGHLLGTDHGEFGGELVLRSRDGRITPVFNDNTRAIHQVGELTLALTGLVHLMMNDGIVYRIEDDRAVRWKRLPGAPRASGFLPDGRLYVSCEGGAVIITTDGTFVSADSLKAQ